MNQNGPVSATGPTISGQHAGMIGTKLQDKVLRQAGLLSGTVEGTATSYCLDEEKIAWFRSKVGDIF